MNFRVFVFYYTFIGVLSDIQDKNSVAIGKCFQEKWIEIAILNHKSLMDDFIFRISGGFHLLKNCILSLPFRAKSTSHSRLQSLQTHQTPVMKIEKLHHQTEWTSNTCCCTFSSLIEKRNRHTIISRSLPSCTRQSRCKDSNGWESANFQLKIK